MQKQIDDIYEKVENYQNKFDFSADKKIDINNLHTEEQCHSELCFRYNKRRSKLSGVVEQLEELKKQKRSQLINDCIAKPELCDPKTAKYSDKKAEAYYRLDSGYIEVIDALLQAKNELDCMAGMQRIIEDKKWQLKDLKDYAMSQYFESTESRETRIVLPAEDAQYEAMDKALDFDKKEIVQDKKPSNKKEKSSSRRRRSR